MMPQQKVGGGGGGAETNNDNGDVQIIQSDLMFFVWKNFLWLLIMNIRIPGIVVVIKGFEFMVIFPNPKMVVVFR